MATNGMSIGRKAVIHAAHVLAATGLNLLTEPDLLKAVRDEFDKRTAGKPYKSLNELGSPPEGVLDAEERHHYECCIHAAMEHFESRKLFREKTAIGTKPDRSVIR